MIAMINASNRATSIPILKEREKDLQVLGTSLTALYIAATCHRKCWGTGHVLEALGARIYNLACASYSLISVGFYDEALALVRSIGEIANLLSLSVTDKPAFTRWVNSTKGERIRDFSPAKVRTLVEKTGVVLMDQAWYSKLCESYTHITPGAKPNNFNEHNRNVCGGMIQEGGVEAALDQLTSIVSMVSLFYCRYFELDDYFELIVKDAKLEN